MPQRTTTAPVGAWGFGVSVRLSSRRSLSRTVGRRNNWVDDRACQFAVQRRARPSARVDFGSRRARRAAERSIGVEHCRFPPHPMPQRLGGTRWGMGLDGATSVVITEQARSPSNAVPAPGYGDLYPRRARRAAERSIGVEHRRIPPHPMPQRLGGTRWGMGLDGAPIVLMTEQARSPSNAVPVPYWNLRIPKSQKYDRCAPRSEIRNQHSESRTSHEKWGRTPPATRGRRS
jgi:hypothetical protein